MVGAQREAAATILRGAVTALGLDDLATVETLAAEGGDPGRALCDLAAERGATVIVAGITRPRWVAGVPCSVRCRITSSATLRAPSSCPGPGDS